MVDAIFGLFKDPVHEIAIVVFFLACFLFVTLVAASWSLYGSQTARNAIAWLKAILRWASKREVRERDWTLKGARDERSKGHAALSNVRLDGRKEMLGLAIAQLKHRLQTGRIQGKPLWVDISAGHNAHRNVEEMHKHLPVTESFRAIYIVNPCVSTTAAARKRYAQMGWNNVYCVCETQRTFHLPQQQEELSDQDLEKAENNGAELVTLSYALSQTSEFRTTVDLISSMLAPNGVLGVCDTATPQAAAIKGCLESGFGTILSLQGSVGFLGLFNPDFAWIGCRKDNGILLDRRAELDSAAVDSPFLSALDLQARKVQSANLIDVHSESRGAAVVNLTASQPLPTTWYQNHNWRIYYEDRASGHANGDNVYSSTFAGADSRADARLLKIQSSDEILALTNGSCNILSLALEQPRRIHAIDANPAQSHLLELKVAAFTALGYSDVWKLFGEGRHEDFRGILISNLSPHMSDTAFQFWFEQGSSAFNNGLYYTGRSGYALRLIHRVIALLGLSSEVNKLCTAQTLNEQREVWCRSLEHLLLSPILSYLLLSFSALWKALSIPNAQSQLIEADYAKSADIPDPSSSSSTQSSRSSPSASAPAIHEYLTQTLRPVIQNTLISEDNHLYRLLLTGSYTRRSHPEYLTPRSHIRLSKPHAFDALRIHTDTVHSVLSTLRDVQLTIAILDSSFDSLSPTSPQLAISQIQLLHAKLKVKGRVLLRSVALKPWYIRSFEEAGFRAERVKARMPGSCVDRVNVWASTWICTKMQGDGGIEGGRRPPGWRDLEGIRI